MPATSNSKSYEEVSPNEFEATLKAPNPVSIAATGTTKPQSNNEYYNAKSRHLIKAIKMSTTVGDKKNSKQDPFATTQNSNGVNTGISKGTDANNTQNKDHGQIPHQKKWIFRDPMKDPLEVGLQYKVMALSDISNANQTFCMTIMEDNACWLTREEFDDFVQLPRNQRRDYRPRYFIHTYVYNSVDHEWHEPNRTLEGCPFHIRAIFGDGRCWAFQQRLGKMTFNQPFQLQGFPFDVQDLTCMFGMFVYTNSLCAQKVRVRPIYGGATFALKFVEPKGEYRVSREHRKFEEKNGYVLCTFKVRGRLCP